VIINGIIPIYKEKGMTSHDVVQKVRRILKIKRIGHSGTLDPNATGVLPICIGETTKICEYLLELPKEYVADMILGISTNTQDSAGKIIEKKEVQPLENSEILNVLKSFVGPQLQIPPMYSAVKIEGKKLYEYARRGITVERKAREINVYNIELISYIHPIIKFSTKVSKGTYIRTLIEDIGKKLNLPTCMTSLIRTKSGPFSLNQTISLENLKNIIFEEKINNYIYSIDEALNHLPSVIVTDENLLKKIQNGQSLKLQNNFQENYNGLIKIMNNMKKVIAIHYYEPSNPQTIVKKVFNLNTE